MKIDDEDLRRLFRAPFPVECPELRKQCPAKKDIVAFFRPRISRKRKYRIIDHISSCALCSEEFAFLLQIHRQQEKLIRNIKKEMPTSFPRLFLLQYAPFAAGLFLFVLVSLFLYRYSPPHHSRSLKNESIRLLHPCGRTTLTSPVLFKWNSELEAEYYILEIFDTSLRPFWRFSDIDSNSYLLPLDIISRMKIQEPYYWIITAVDSTGQKIESKIQVFILNQ